MTPTMKLIKKLLKMYHKPSKVMALCATDARHANLRKICLIQCFSSQDV